MFIYAKRCIQESLAERIQEPSIQKALLNNLTQTLRNHNFKIEQMRHLMQILFFFNRTLKKANIFGVSQRQTSKALSSFYFQPRIEHLRRNFCLVFFENMSTLFSHNRIILNILCDECISMS